ncbi:MAG: broad-specificity cellobiase [Marmoricola sp.]|nr:broad-specificity cellobiase [Marmoricola sp.]
MSNPLPDGSRLTFGTATASYQIEGGPLADGRLPSIWDIFTGVPGKIDDDSDGSVACASYPDPGPDIDLVAGLGVGLYRFSVAWPRVVPEGGTEVNKLGLDYYERLVDGLLERDVTPMATLYHWDLPQTLEDRGGWLVRETAERFADYSLAVHDRLGDRVRLWATLNEPWCSAYLGYASGRHAPGRQVGAQAHRATHHLLLGHGLAAARLREAGADGVGIVLNLTPVIAESEAAAEATDGVDALRNRVWLGPLVDGAYDAGTLRVAPVLADPDLVRPGDLDLVRGSADWLGVNYYTPSRVTDATAAPDPADPAADADLTAFPGLTGFRFAPRHPRTDMDWEVDPDSFTRLLVDTYDRTGLPLVVTENGAAYADATVLPDGTVDDADRIDYLAAHLAAIDSARDAGADVRAWLVWTLMDNFEWSHGYLKKFGLVSVDRADLTRAPKRSYHWLAEVVRRRGR